MRDALRRGRQAGAIDFFGRSAGLPPALSGDRTYFLWGPRGYSGDCAIVLDDRKEVLERYWQSVEYVGTSAPNPWALELEIPVFICRTKKFASWDEVWPGSSAGVEKKGLRVPYEIEKALCPRSCLTPFPDSAAELRRAAAGNA